MGYYVEALCAIGIFGKKPMEITLFGLTNDDEEVSVDLGDLMDGAMETKNNRPLPDPDPWGLTGPVRTVASLRSLSPRARFDLVVASHGALNEGQYGVPRALTIGLSLPLSFIAGPVGYLCSRCLVRVYSRRTTQ